MASLSLALPGLARCERPSAASLRISGVQPGRLAQGPEENCAFFGRAAGAFAILIHPFRWAPLVGERCPERFIPCKVPRSKRTYFLNNSLPFRRRSERRFLDMKAARSISAWAR